MHPIFRDNFAGVPKSYINKILNKRITRDEYRIIIKYVEERIKVEIKDILVQSIKDIQSGKIVEFALYTYMKNNKIIYDDAIKIPFAMTKSKRILCEIVQSDIPSFTTVYEFSKYGWFNRLFNTCIHYLFTKYILEYASSSGNTNKIEKKKISMIIEI
jgi:hypothetical protein